MIQSKSRNKKFPNVSSEENIKLNKLPVNIVSKIINLDDEEMDINLLRDCFDQGLLPGSEVSILKIYQSQKKMIIQINGSIIVAIPIAISEKINVSYKRN